MWKQVGRAIKASCLALTLTVAWAAENNALPLEKIKLPQGFRIELYAKVPNARAMTLGSEGVLYVGTRGHGAVYAVVDADGDFQGEKVVQIDNELRLPSGVAFRDGSLYVGAIDRILRYDDIGQRLDNPPEPAIVVDDLPKEAHHGWKYLGFGPDGWLYVPVGAPCNVCKRENPVFASILRMKPDGSGREVFAHGVRNTVGFDWHPVTKELWFTDNGRDWLGDDLPPDELNRAPRAGLHFGFPHYHGKTIADPEFGKGRQASEFEPAAIELGPHVAAIGMTFYNGAMFPSKYRGQPLIAEHGSWNRSKKIGYRVTLVRLDPAGKKALSYEVFAEGWLNADGSVWGRPADTLALPDGSLLVSDDFAGAIYRIVYGP